MKPEKPELGDEVDVFYAFAMRAGPFTHGKVVAVLEEPSVVIELSDGSKMHWARSLTRKVEE